MTSAIPEPGSGRRALDTRTPEQVAMERAAQKVSDVLLNLEHSNAQHALKELIPQLERARKRLQQDTYFAGDNLRLV